MDALEPQLTSFFFIFKDVLTLNISTVASPKNLAQRTIAV
jgi:hypothetical protein